MAGRGFPGRVFLSEKERQVRRDEEKERRRSDFTLLRDFSEARLNEAEFNRGRVRHQMEIFKGGTTCYIMTESPIPIGTDTDNDGVNEYLEIEYKTDPLIADTDGDGLKDGLEIFYLESNPTMRDTDNDGIVDGLEDLNRNGYYDFGETNPLDLDSDRDGLCDGLCRVGTNGSVVRGEDINLNSKVDTGETDPRKEDSDGNGIMDEQEYFNCIMRTGSGSGTRTCNYSAFRVQ